MRLLIFLLLVSSSCSAQGVRPVAAINMGVPILVVEHGTQLSPILKGTLQGGVCIDDWLFVQTGLGHNVSQFKADDERRFSVITHYSSLALRILKDKVVSPVFGVDFGYQLFSGAKGKIVDYNFMLNSVYTDESIGIFRRIRRESSIFVQWSAQVKQCYVVVGVGYQYSRIELERIHDHSTKLKNFKAINANLSLVYSF